MYFIIFRDIKGEVQSMSLKTPLDFCEAYKKAISYPICKEVLQITIIN
jgi:hypothetical protein